MIEADRRAKILYREIVGPFGRVGLAAVVISRSVIGHQFNRLGEVLDGAIVITIHSVQLAAPNVILYRSRCELNCFAEVFNRRLVRILRGILEAAFRQIQCKRPVAGTALPFSNFDISCAGDDRPRAHAVVTNFKVAIILGDKTGRLIAELCSDLISVGSSIARGHLRLILLSSDKISSIDLGNIGLDCFGSRDVGVAPHRVARFFPSDSAAIE